jgi:proline dehydrogenase
VAPAGHTPAHYGFDVPVLTGSEGRRLLERPLVGRVLTGMLTGRLVAGARIDDGLRVAGELVAAGHTVALEHVPGPGEDVAAELAVLVGRVHAAGLAADCELLLPVDRLGAVAARRLGEAAAEAGLGVALAGRPALVDPLAALLPGARVVVPAGAPGAEERCRALAAGPVRLTRGPALPGRRAAADLAFVRCLNVLMAEGGRPAVEATDPRLIAITGERAAWNGRAPDSWEHVMPYGVRTDEQHRLVAAGYAVRVCAPSGPGAAAVVARRLAGRA